MDDVLVYIDHHLEETIERLQKFCRQPSIAAHDLGMAEMADLVRESLDQAGARAELVPTGGYPVLMGRFAGVSAKTLMFYNHYDVQPPAGLMALSRWSRPLWRVPARCMSSASDGEFLPLVPGWVGRAPGAMHPTRIYAWKTCNRASSTLP